MFNSCKKEESKELKKKIEKTIPISNKEKVVDIPENLKKFIPENYAILDSTKGNLNLDEFNDMILVLKKNGEKESSNVVDDPEERPLLILTGNSKNEYKLEERNDNTVYCIDCGGIMGDPFVGIVIKKGFFSVEHYGGSAWRWSKTITYKYYKNDRNWFLHKDGFESFHVNDPEKVESKIKTVKDFGKVSFKNFDIYKDN